MPPDTQNERKCAETRLTGSEDNLLFDITVFFVYEKRACRAKSDLYTCGNVFLIAKELG